MVMSRSESGKLGAEKAKGTLLRMKAEKIYNYLKTPNYCAYCKSTLSYEHRKHTYCNSSCSAKQNNPLRTKIKEMRYCISCDSILIKHATKFCNSKCQMNYRSLENIENWKHTGIIGKKALKRYLTETYGYKCRSCGISEWNNKPIVLELEHINGDSNDNSETNVCLICPNCHSQTSTYKGKNKGNGRHFRRERYKLGKSY